MSKLDDLFPDLTKLSDDDLLDLIKEIRTDRRISKGSKKKEGKTKDNIIKELREALKALPADRVKEILNASD